MAHWPQHNIIRLPGKLSVQLSAYVYAGAEPLSGTTPIVVFLNSLGRPQSAWKEVIRRFRALASPLNPLSWLITYDRIGQGESERDPSAGAQDAGTAADDLRGLLKDIVGNEAEKETDMEVDTLLADVPLVLVSNAFGCPVARLYHNRYPPTTGTGGVRAHLFLDSYMTDTDFVSLFPAKGEGEEEALTRSREGIERTFHPRVLVREGISRENLKELLPRSDAPPLAGEPWITVGTHEAELFANADGKNLGMDPEMTLKYFEPAWIRYQSGLVKLTSPSRARGPEVVKGAGHTIQCDRPDWVVQELEALLQNTFS